jgi:hypothetical protein
MTELIEAGIVLFVLVGSTVLGLFVQSLLGERHRGRETTELVRLVSAMMVTFTGLVLGLLLTTVKSSFDRIDSQLKVFSAQLIQLDQTLRLYGADADAARGQLRSYAAAAIASTWTEEPKPPGDYYPKVPPVGSSGFENPALGDMLARVERTIRELAPADLMHRRLAAECVRQFERLTQQHWRFIEDSGRPVPVRFTIVLVFWLALVFASFGLNAPRNILAYTTIALAAVSIASAIYLILDLATPYGGMIATSSQAMRDALSHLSE